MATITRRSGATSLALLLLPFIFVSTSAHKQQRPSSDAEFTCRTTPFPEVCQRSTSLLSPTDSQDLNKLARAVFVLGLESAKTASFYVKATDHPGSPLHGCAKSMADCVDVLTMALEELDHLGQGQPRSRQYDVSVGKVVTFATEAVTDANACLQLASEVQSGAVVMDAAVETVRHTMQLASVGVALAKRMNDAPKQHPQGYRIHSAPSGGSI